MTTKVKLLLPWPPSINNYYGRIRGTDRQYIKAPGKEFRERVVKLYSTDTPLQGNLQTKVIAYKPDRRRRDLDNLMKATYDALTHAGVYEDDQQIVCQTHEWGPVVKPGLIYIEVEPIEVVYPSAEEVLTDLRQEFKNNEVLPE